jgi:2-polyprenyl-6-methoxyphenol hydroxylase-like FAD-dependent oxidoreductase
METYDVVVVGASIAGCTAATLYARDGLKVALLDAHRDADMYKRLCTHFIQSSATPTIERLGITDEIDRLGAVRNMVDLWTSYGWVREPATVAGCPPHGYSVRRQVLDPLLRRTAAAEPTVDLLLGAKVFDLVYDANGRVIGVVASTPDGKRELRGRLVVGADGNTSKVAALADLPAQELPNNRIGYLAHYRGAKLTGWPRAKLWLRDNGDAVYVFPNDDDVLVLAAMPGKHRTDEFRKGDAESALLASYDGLPEAPDMSGAERVSDVIGTTDYPSLLRKNITRPGVALIGDAAMVGDPLWGVGCGWAFQSAAWLVDATSAVLRAGGDVDAAAARYAKTHGKRLRPHHKLISDFSRVRPYNRLERLIFSAAPHDAVVSDAFWRYGTRNASPLALLTPRVLLHAARARTHVTRAAGVATDLVGAGSLRAAETSAD